MCTKSGLTLLAGIVCLSGVLNAQAARNARITGAIDDTKVVRLTHSTHPLARPEFDRGSAPANLRYDRMLLVLRPSPDREAALETLLRAQQDPSSTQFHKWLTPAKFGAQFGAVDADISKVTGWLQGQGFQVAHVATGRNVIEFSGTAGQVAAAFHTQIHSYVVNAKQHWANASDAAIPAALVPVVAGVATLHNFQKASQITNLKPQAVRIETGARPSFTGSNGSHALAPADFSAIYNLQPLYQQNINGGGVTIAVVGRSNINLQDIQDFKNAFGVPNNLPQVVVNGTDPGDQKNGDETEAVLDLSWSAALAPNATVKLVASASTNSSDGVDLSEEYIIDNNLADVITESYGDCEANYTPAEAQFYFALAQQAAAQGITFAVAAGDSGAEGCDDPGSETVASGPVSVNVLASTPYNVAVGGTQFNENGNAGYWSSGNNAGFTSAQSYIPEIAWNESCTAAQCGASNAGIWAGAGGASILFSKPSWQTGVIGIPNDGARDVPDISFSSASHDFYLLCLDGSCTTKLGRSYFSGVSGTSAATPSFAAIMALIVQQTGTRQGQAAPTLYRLASGELFGACIAQTPAANCVFNDVVLGNNAVPGETGYGGANAAYQAGVGYDLTTGLGSINVANMASNWMGSSTLHPAMDIGIDQPSPLFSILSGLTTFSGWARRTSTDLTSVELSIDGVSVIDACLRNSAGICASGQWSELYDTTRLANGSHTLAETVGTKDGSVYTVSTNFTVANWTTANPMKVNIDTPSATTLETFSGTAHFGGWALDDLAAISRITLAVDGTSYGTAQYGGERSDVCAIFPGRAGCPDVGWNASLDLTTLAEGPHTFSVTAQSAGGQLTTISRPFLVANTPSNKISISIDRPGVQSGSFSGGVGFGGWALGSTVPITNVAVTIDGLASGNAQYNGARPDVCKTNAGSAGCPNVGWNYWLDTTQVVDGTHVLGITASTATGQFATATRLFTVANGSAGFPVAMGMVSPSQMDSLFVGATEFEGWALEDEGTISRVDVAIDGVVKNTYPSLLNGSGGCALHPTARNCPNSDWDLYVDMSALANGTHMLTVTATAADGRRGTISAPFTVANWTTGNPMQITSDRPNSSTGPLSGLLGIGGWAIDRIGQILSLQLAVDDVPVGVATYGGSRADVCAIVGNALGCPNVGWNFLLDTTQLTDGTHTLAITGMATGGRTSTFTQVFQVANRSLTPVAISIDTPSTNETLTQQAHVGGWAVDSNGAQIVSVTVLVDGIPNGIAEYGGDRSDVCAIYRSGGGCPNVGWNYTVDTRTYANGPHTLAAEALAADGQKYTASQTFIVANQP